MLDLDAFDAFGQRRKPEITTEPSQAQQYRSSTASKQTREQPAPRWGAVPPSEYLRAYDKLTPVSKANFGERVFANGRSTHSSPLVTRNALELLPRIYSFDPRVLNFQQKLSEELNKHIPVDLDADGFTSTGVHTTFDRLKCPAGYFMTPMSYTAVDNTLYREELGLKPMTNRQRVIAQEVWRLVWRYAKVSSVNVAKLSTGGMRRMTSDVQWKLAFAEWLFEVKNFEQMLDLVASEDWERLANEYETVYAMYYQKRGQVDTPGKVRKVFDLEYALSGGRKGKLFPSDKDVVINGIAYPDFSAIRARVVQAGPWVINCFIQCIGTPTMRALFERFPKTFHVNTREQILAEIQGKYVFCSDVTEYDRSMEEEDIRIPHDTMAEVWDERLVKASWRLMTSPYYSRPLSIEGRGGVWVGDPTDWSSRVVAGNRSGHGLTSLIAKVNKVIDTLGVIDLLYPVIGRCEWYLEGKGVIGFVNNGDDEIIWTNNKMDLDRFKKLRVRPEVGRYSVSAEVGQGFSGLLLRRVGETEYDPCARVHTTFEKQWVPERSIGGEHRKYWTIGCLDRINNIMRTPRGQEAWDIHMRVYREHMAPHFRDFMSIIMDEHAKVRLRMDLTAADREVLDDPNKLHHKWDQSDIQKGVLDLVTSNIPASTVEGFITRYYKGNML